MRFSALAAIAAMLGAAELPSLPPRGRAVKIRPKPKSKRKFKGSKAAKKATRKGR